MTTKAGFKQGSHSACVFYHEQRNVRVVVHGDDFTVLGPSKVWTGSVELHSREWK